MEKQTAKNHTLRRRAEDKLGADASEPHQAPSREESRKLFHELQVHKIELEMQNEELNLTLTAMREHEEYLLNVIKKTPAGYFALDRGGYFIDVNDAWLRMHGYYSPDEVIGKHFSITFVDRYSDRMLEHLANLLNGQDIPLGEFSSLRKDGSVGYHTFSAHPVIHADKVVRLEWFIIDVTERKLADDALRQSEERYRAILRTTMDGFWVVDSKGRILEVNEAYCHMSGYSNRELLSMNISELEAVKAADDIITIINMLKVQGSARFESRHRRKDGTVIDVEISAQYRHEDGGQCVVFIRDITEQNKDEKARRALEQQLLQAQKMEAIGNLAGGIAHDFNNKLMVIMGNAELARMHIDDSGRVLGCLEEIHRAAAHSRDITSRLLAFSRRQASSPQNMDVNRAIADSIKSLSRLIGEHIAISFVSGHDLWSVRIDPVQLDQIVMNLAINARDAMPDGGAFAIETGNITVENQECISGIDRVPGDFVRIVFRDSGSGMDEETITHVFEPFFTTKSVGKGTGLGLSTIYGIISQNGGFVEVASTPGHGTAFKVHLPRHDAPSKESFEGAGTVCMGSGTILLVEDEDAVRIVTSEFLEKIGYAVYEAQSPRKALELASDLSIHLDIVLTDVVMPEMNGMAMMEQIRKIRPGMPCIYVSGHSTDHAVLSEDAIFDGPFIQKPYNLSTLSGCLKQVLTVRQEM